MVNPSSLTTAMQFLRGDGDKLGSNGGSNNVGINPLDTLTLTFIMFVSIESKYFDGAFSFVYCTSIFAFLERCVD